MFCLLKRARTINLPLDTLLSAFDVMVAPILLYGSEVWGYENTDLIEKIHLKFLKLACGLRSSTPSFMVYGELGRMPLYINIYKRMIAYWHKIRTHCAPSIKLSNIICNYLYCNVYRNNMPNAWLSSIEHILNTCGIPAVFNNPGSVSTLWLTAHVERIMKDQYIQKWREAILISPKGNYYSCIKDTIVFERYLLLPKSISCNILKFRTSNHKLPIETGRWRNVPRYERTCPFCPSPALADEFHYLFRCEYFDTVRRKYVAHKYLCFPNIYKYKRLLCTSILKEIKNLSNFIKIIMSSFAT
jgi:hypothetical protein